MNIINYRIKLMILLVSFVVSGAVRAAVVEITFSAEISTVVAFTNGPTIDPNESWIDFVGNNIHIGDQITGTFRYHTSPDSFYQFYDSNGEPSNALYLYNDASAGLDLSLTSAGLTWSTAPDPANLPFQVTSAVTPPGVGGGFDNIKGYGEGTAASFPDLLYRDYPYAINSLNLEIYINDALPRGEVPLLPIDMNNLNYGFGEITMSENWETTGLGDYFYVGYNITDVATTISYVPLPGTMWLLMSGLFGVLGFVKRPMATFFKNA